MSDEITRRLDAQDRTLERIEGKVDTTNGRVRDLELWKAKMEGAKWAVGWVPPLVTAAFSSGIAVLLSSIFLTH